MYCLSGKSVTLNVMFIKFNANHHGSYSWPIITGVINCGGGGMWSGEGKDK